MLKEYYYLTKPGIVRANVLTATAGFIVASGTDISISLLSATLIGTAFVIASGCIFNNILDKQIDQKMERTKKRALVTGTISNRAAILFALSIGLLGLLVLITMVNLLTAFIGVLAIILYVLIYGYAKRHTPLSTEIGTLPGAASILAGYTASANQLTITGFLLFCIMVIWQMPHFYAIAIFRAKEYAAAKLPIASLTKGISAVKKRIIFYIVLYAGVSLLLTWHIPNPWLYLTLSITSSLFWFYTAINKFNMKDDIKWARKVFGASLLVLLVFCLNIVLSTVLP